MESKYVLLGAKKTVIEPLGLLHLATVCKQEGYIPKIILFKNDFNEFDKAIKEYNPKYIGFSILTGSHIPIFDYLKKVKAQYKNIKLIAGSSHATYFPLETKKYADYVVLSEGFNSFRRILKGNVEPGIVPLTTREDFPHSDRGDFYKENKEYDDSPIKSVIAGTGCPWACSYCYNSSTIDSLEGVLTQKQKTDMASVIGKSKRLFPKSQRSVDEIIEEIHDIKKISPNTKMIYFQDDVFGGDIVWVREFCQKYKGLPFHAQMRFENANPDNETCRERLILLRNAGCTGLTFAIESSNPIIREEVLNRKMDDGLIFEAMNHLERLGYKVRTEQMLGLPYGATKEETKINLDADLETLALNVRLKKETELPNLSWASIFAPYRGTKIGEYCKKHGFYQGENNDVPETFFQRSVLRFPKEYVGPELVAGMNDKWMKEEAQEKYRDDMSLLRDLFSYFATITEGHKLAERFIKGKDHSYSELSKVTRHHLYNYSLYNIGD